jgi:membrane associated rhomboid family serine protease
VFPLKDTIPCSIFPIFNYLLIITCTLAFFGELSVGDQGLNPFIDTWGLVPAHLIAHPDVGEIETIFTSMFLHGGWGHLLGNMWFLYIFGDNVEERFGHFFYPIFYLFCGCCAALAQVFINPDSNVAMIGASGAISGVLGAYFIFYPQARVLTLIPLGVFTRIMEVPAILFLGLWFLMQFFTGVSALAISSAGEETGGVAFWAHVGGFVAGVVIALFMPKPGYSESAYYDHPKYYRDSPY